MTHLEGNIGKLHFLRSKIDVGYQRSWDGIYVRRLLKITEQAMREHDFLNLVIRPHHESIVDPIHGSAILSAMFLAKGLIVSEYARRMTLLERTAADPVKGGTPSFWRGHILNVVKDSPRLSAFAVDWARRRVLAKRKLPSVVLQSNDDRYVVDLSSEQSPYRESRVRLGPQQDRYGTPMLIVDWKVSVRDRHAIQRAVRFVSEHLKNSNLVRLEIDDHELEEKVNGLTRVGGHQIGTARMGSSPFESVVNRDGEVWTTKNLFVCGAATFPTSGVAGPTLTAIALAVRLSYHVSELLSRQPHQNIQTQ
jgi:choline dehydrogenase-like flavoprotein